MFALPPLKRTEAKVEGERAKGLILRPEKIRSGKVLGCPENSTWKEIFCEYYNQYGRYINCYSKIKIAWDQILKFLEEHCCEIFYSVKEGTSEEDLNHLEANIGCKLPDDLRCAYRIHNGQKLSVPGMSMHPKALESDSCQLETRHWRTVDEDGKVELVNGPGVVGEFPIMRPGETYSWISCTNFSTTHGSMFGHFRMRKLKTGEIIDVQCPPFHMHCLPYLILDLVNASQDILDDFPPPCVLTLTCQRLQPRPVKHSQDPNDTHLTTEYKKGEFLGKGSFGTVVKAEEINSSKPWAIKTVYKDQAGKHSVKLLEREIAILKMVQHPHIIYLHEVFETPEKVCLVLELCPQALRDVLRFEGTFSEMDTRTVIQRLLSAVSYLHKNGIVHRDLKLENILVGENPNEISDRLFVKVTDFGLSVVKGGIGHENMLRCFCGTPTYMARNLLKGMLKLDPAYRLTANEILSHPWILGLGDNCTAPTTVLDLMHQWRDDMVISNTVSHVDEEIKPVK
uniref:Protein kinase domain-containing protein n=1 Tax=Strigamia maritima TaxID=126957 RepID=T1IGW5_STRMM